MNNWQWRVRPAFLTTALSDSIYAMTKLYGRLGPGPQTENESEEGPAEG